MKTTNDQKKIMKNFAIFIGEKIETGKMNASDVWNDDILNLLLKEFLSEY